MIDSMKSIAIVALLWINALLIVTACNLLGNSTALDAQRISAEKYAIERLAANH